MFNGVKGEIKRDAQLIKKSSLLSIWRDIFLSKLKRDVLQYLIFNGSY